MKVFHRRAGKSWSQERKMLESLKSFNHEHILQYEATWSQGELLYMLFPCAASNLRKLMDERCPHKLTEEFVLWIFDQLRGLADALRVIHHQAGPAIKALTPQPHGHLSGFHHDVKPENILFVSRAPPTSSCQISDCRQTKARWLRYMARSITSLQKSRSPYLNQYQQGIRALWTSGH